MMISFFKHSRIMINFFKHSRIMINFFKHSRIMINFFSTLQKVPKIHHSGVAPHYRAHVTLRVTDKIMIYFSLKTIPTVKTSLLCGLKDSIMVLMMTWAFASYAFLMNRNQLDFDSMFMCVRICSIFSRNRVFTIFQ